MIDRNGLKAMIVKNGCSQKDMAKLLNMSTKTFYSRMKRGNFGVDEAKILIEALGIENPAEIFFAS